jgi:hypothetical protein
MRDREGGKTLNRTAIAVAIMEPRAKFLFGPPILYDPAINKFMRSHDLVSSAILCFGCPN